MHAFHSRVLLNTETLQDLSLFKSRHTVLRTVINSNEQIPLDSFAVHASEKHFTSLHCHPRCMLHVFLVNVYVVDTFQTFSA